MNKLVFVVAFLSLLMSGCAGPYFYQAGKSLEECERDLLECRYESEKAGNVPYGTWRSPISAGVQSGVQKANLTCMCMQLKGYGILAADALPEGIRRKTVYVYDIAGK